LDPVATNNPNPIIATVAAAKKKYVFCSILLTDRVIYAYFQMPLEGREIDGVVDQSPQKKCDVSLSKQASHGLSD
jgi:hypothetical protein